MTKHSLSDRPLYGRTFHSIMWVVALIATIQLFAMSLAIMKRVSLNTAATGRGTISSVPAPPQTVTAPVPDVEPIPPVVTGPPQPNRERTPVAQTGAGNLPVPSSQEPPPPPARSGILEAAAAKVPEPSGPVFMGPATATEPVSLSAALSQAAKDNVLSDEPILERLLATGAELRGSGNMQGALQAFREVETALPAHPRVLSELAATLGQMGLEEKAGAYWERVESLGPEAGGAYFALAGQQLRGEPVLPPVGLGSLDPAPSSGSVKLRIGAVKVEEEAPTSEGQKVTLRVMVETDPGMRPVGEDLALLVYFYDQVAGGMVQPSTADTSYLYPTEPYDWQIDSREEIIVSYHQPVFTEEQKRDLGERSYYGYAIELYYRDQIQDKVAMPEDIAKLRVEPAAEPDKDEGVIGPENALFPESVIP